MRYFVIGSGSIGRRHADNLARLGANVVLCPWRGIDLEDVLSEIASCNGRSGVIIATATKTRLPLILQCAAAGAALYIEKPIAFRASDLREIFTLPESVLCRSVAGFMMRYHPIVDQLTRSVPAHFYGAAFHVGHDIKQWRANWSFSDSYASDPDGGGVLLDLCHEIDLADLLCGPTELQSVNSIEHSNFAGIDLVSTINLLGPKGQSILVAMDYLAPSLIRRGHIRGLNDEINFDLAKSSFSHLTKSGCITKHVEETRNKMFLNLMLDFMALAEGRKTTNPNIPRLDRVKHTCELIGKAWEMRSFTGQIKANLK